MTRAEKVAEAQRLYADGLTVTEIAKRMGTSRSNADAYINDPDLSKQRARRLERYSGTCIDCFAPTDGSNGRAQTPERCAPCRAKYQRTLKFWTRQRVVDAIQRWVAIHGRPPKASEWVRADREGGFPANSLVGRHPDNPSGQFATWNEAIEAAGFTPTPQCHYHADPKVEHELRVRSQRKGAA